MAATPNEWVGASLSGGRYRVDAKLGEGGMGFVYKAWDRNLDTDLVVKVPRRAMLEDAEFSGRFAREIRSLVRLSHPNIVKISDVGEHDGLPFAVMQFLPGGDLEGRQARGRDGSVRPSHPATLAAWLPGVASALDFIHREKYIHRDVKPANILFDAHGHAFLSDFGVAKVLGDSEGAAHRGGSVTGAGIVLGTPEYMAPELVMGEPFDGRVDQYALAATAYELLCGRPAFPGETATAILVRQTTQAPPPLVELPEQGAGEISRVVLRGLAKAPADRFASCGDFARALVEAAAIAGAPRAAVVPDKLVCPLCGRQSPMPAVVLADPAKVAGRKTSCPGCKAPLRFADDGLGLVVPGPSPRVAGATVPLDARASGLSTAVGPGARTTMKVGPGPDAARMPATEAIAAPALVGPDLGRTAGTWASPRNLVIGGASFAIMISIGLAMALLLNREPASPARTIARGVEAQPAPAQDRVGRKDPEATRPAAAIEASPPPRIAAPPIPTPASPPPPPPVAATTEPEAAPPTPPIESAIVASKSGHRPPALPHHASAPVVDETPVLGLTLKQIVEDPEPYLGRHVIPADLLKIDSQIRRGGDVTVHSRNCEISPVSLSNTNFRIALSFQLEGQFQQLLKRRQILPGTYIPILKMRIQKDPTRPGGYVGMVDRLEILWNMIYAHVASRKYDRAFQVIVIEDDAVRPGLGDGKEWESRLSGSFLNHIRLEYHRMQKAARDHQFEVMQGQVARNAAEMAAMAAQAQKQQQEILRKLMLGK